MTDWRTILKSYMAWVFRHSVETNDPYEPLLNVTDEENEKLQEVYEELRREWKGKK
jgi:hypothetical protein